MKYDRSKAMSFVEVLRWLAEHSGNDVAFNFLSEGEVVGSLTYADLDRSARVVAVELQRRGLAGRSALMIFAPGRDFIVALMGCFYAGVTAIPSFPPRLGKQSSRLAQIAIDAKPAIGLTSSEVLRNYRKTSADYALVKGLEWLETDLFAGDPILWAAPEVSPDHVAFIQYTSGSTSVPRGVMLTQANLLANSASIEGGFGHSEDSIGLVWLPPYHDMGLIGGILQPIYAGFTCYLMQPLEFLRSPINWLRAVSRYRATTSGGPNFSYEMCVSRTTKEERKGLDLSHWRVAFNGAEPVRNETLDHFYATFAPFGFDNNAFFPCYGLAEATLFVSGSIPSKGRKVLAVSAQGLESNRVTTPGDGSDQRVLVGSGVAAPSVEIRIIDPGTMKDCASNEIGEIWTRGPGNAAGYWGRPQESECVFGGTVGDAGGYLRTGDLGFMADEQLFVTGRIKDLIILNGRNIYPQDIEWSVGLVSQSLGKGIGAAFGVEHEGSERLVVVHELVGAPADLDGLVGQARSALIEEYDIQPLAVVFVRRGSLPTTTSGKVRRHACKNAYLEGRLEVIHVWDESSSLTVPVEASRAPKSPLEFMMLELAMEILGRKDISVTADFLSLGVHSLALAKFISQLGDLLGQEFPLSLAFEHPTIERLAAAIAQSYQPADAHERRLEALIADIRELESASS